MPPKAVFLQNRCKITAFFSHMQERCIFFWKKGKEGVKILFFEKSSRKICVYKKKAVSLRANLNRNEN